MTHKYIGGELHENQRAITVDKDSPQIYVRCKLKNPNGFHINYSISTYLPDGTETGYWAAPTSGNDNASDLDVQATIVKHFSWEGQPYTLGENLYLQFWVHGFGSGHAPLYFRDIEISTSPLW